MNAKLNPAPLMKCAAIAAAAVCSVSCTVGPDYVRPSADVPAAYKEAQPGAMGLQVMMLQLILNK